MTLKLLQAVTLLCLANEILCLSCIELQQKSEKECFTSDMRKSHNGNYGHCVKTRMKRHQSFCDNDVDDDDYYCRSCSCDSCSYNKCEGQCESCCHSCCANYVQCHTNHCCHEQCRYECGTSSCRSNCRESCYRTLHRNQAPEKIVQVQPNVVDGNGAAAVQKDSSASTNNNSNLRNVTTVINVKNVVNSTNFLTLPINMTSINRNNITLKELEHGGGSTQDCCIVIGPKQCIPTQVSPYTRCFHTRSRQCGSYCSASIVHQETRQICNSMDSYGRATNCQQQVAYIPQPQPRCVYTSSWPYVSCGIQPPSNCEGCYSQFVNSQIKQYKPCPPQCFDSFNVGPLYRQGPFYQPPYQPPTTCAFSPQGCFSGFGGVGWPGLGSFGAGAAQFAPQGFGAGNVGFSGFQPTGLPVQPNLDGFPGMWNLTALNSSAGTLEAAQPQLVEEPQNDMPFVYRLWEAYKGRQENDSNISVVDI